MYSFLFKEVEFNPLIQTDKSLCSLKGMSYQAHWLIPVIPAIQKAKIGRIEV
jgi:hypothetical protein